MKKKIFLCTMMAAALLSIAFKVTDDIIIKLGIRSDDAQKYILSNLVGDFRDESSSAEEDNGSDQTGQAIYMQQRHFQLPSLKLLPSIIKGDKVGMAKELCAYIKLYCNSEEFMTAYTAKREKNKPTSEPPRPDPEMIKYQRESVKEMETELSKEKKRPGMNPQVLAAYETSLKQQKDLLAQWEDPTPNKTNWEKNYPADPAVFIKKRLQEYLALVITVDFSAALISDKYNTKTFVDPKYEKKDIKWKACYRAGKEVNEVVTAFAKDWLKEEIISATKTKMPAVVEDSNNATATTEKTIPPVTDKKEKPVSGKKSIFKKIKDKIGN